MENLHLATLVGKNEGRRRIRGAGLADQDYGSSWNRPTKLVAHFDTDRRFADPVLGAQGCAEQQRGDQDERRLREHLGSLTVSTEPVGKPLRSRRRPMPRSRVRARFPPPQWKSLLKCAPRQARTSTPLATICTLHNSLSGVSTFKVSTRPCAENSLVFQPSLEAPRRAPRSCSGAPSARRRYRRD